MGKKYKNVSEMLRDLGEDTLADYIEERSLIKEPIVKAFVEALKRERTLKIRLDRITKLVKKILKESEL